jgi:spermidine synthase
MTFAWASEDCCLPAVSLADLTTRYQHADFQTCYYNPGLHQACFALPQYLVDELAGLQKN